MISVRVRVVVRCLSTFLMIVRTGLLIMNQNSGYPPDPYAGNPFDSRSNSPRIPSENPYATGASPRRTAASPARTYQAPLKHSGFGIASFVLSLLSGIVFIGAFVLAIILVANRPNPPADDDPAMVLIGLAFVAAVCMFLVSVALGVITLFQVNRRKVLGIIGLILGSIGTLTLGGLLLIGLLMD